MPLCRETLWNTSGEAVWQLFGQRAMPLSSVLGRILGLSPANQLAGLQRGLPHCRMPMYPCGPTPTALSCRQQLERIFHFERLPAQPEPGWRSSFPLNDREVRLASPLRWWGRLWLPHIDAGRHVWLMPGSHSVCAGGLSDCPVWRQEFSVHTTRKP